MFRTTFKLLMKRAAFKFLISVARVFSPAIIYAPKGACYFFCYFCLLILLSCRGMEPESKYEEKLVVYSILNPDLPQQFVIVDRTYEINEEIEDTTGLSGCKVKIWKEGTEDTVFFEELPDSAGFYIDMGYSGWVEPLSTYYFKVSHKAHTLSAYTTVPDTFSMLHFSDGDTVKLSDNPPLVWSKSEAAAIYIIWPFLCGDTSKVFMPLATMDTTIPLFSYEETYFDSVAWYTIKVFAHDTNRYEYGRRSPGIPDTLDSGYGLFGSQAMDTVKLYIKK